MILGPGAGSAPARKVAGGREKVAGGDKNGSGTSASRPAPGSSPIIHPTFQAYSRNRTILAVWTNVRLAVLAAAEHIEHADARDKVDGEIKSDAGARAAVGKANTRELKGG